MFAAVLVGAACLFTASAAALPFFFIAKAPSAEGALSLRVPVTHDLGVHFEQSRGFYDGLAAGEIYPRWEEGVNRGFGAPTFSYYPPGIYYLTAAFYAAGSDTKAALLGATFAMMLASAGAFYLYARQTMGHTTALLGMTAYVLGPYHLLDLYARGAMAELLAFVWMPLMLYLAHRLLEPEEPARASSQSRVRAARATAGLALVYGAFIWSHPPTAYQFTLVFSVYAVTHGLMRRSMRGIVRVGAALGVGLALGAAYLLPAALERGLVRVEYIGVRDPYHQWYILGEAERYVSAAGDFIRQLDGSWLSGCVVIVLGSAALLLSLRTRMSKRPLSICLLCWIVMGVIASFMMSVASRSLGKLIPGIEVGVFPWRMLAITTLVVALICGALVEIGRNMITSSVRPGVRLMGSCNVGFGVLIACALLVTGLRSAVWSNRGSPAFEPGITEHLDYALSPRSAYTDLERLPHVERSVLDDGGTVEIERWTPGRRVIKVDSRGSRKLIVRTFRSPGWTAEVDGKPVPLVNGRVLGVDGVVGNDSDNDERASPASIRAERGIELGDIGIPLESGKHVVTLEYRKTPIRQAGTALTIAALASLTLLVGVPQWLASRAKHLGE